MPKLPGVTKDKGRCGPKFNAKMCTGGNFCNEANGWCGDTDAHRDAQESTMYDGAASKVCKDSPITIFTSQSKWTCAQYENYQWCKGGVIEQGWTKSQQKRFNAEEAVKNCCACGKNDGASAAAEKAAAEKAAAEKAAAEKAKAAAHKAAAAEAKAAAERAAAEKAKAAAAIVAADQAKAAAEQRNFEKFGIPQVCKLANGCPLDKPFIYPGYTRCFATKWNAPRCDFGHTVDANHPACTFPCPPKQCKLANGCPLDKPFIYPGYT